MNSFDFQLLIIFRFVKKVEHSWKALVHDGVCNTSYFSLTPGCFIPYVCSCSHVCPVFISGHSVSAQAQFLCRQISEIHGHDCFQEEPS